jgi:hypothetical protein
MCLRCAKCKKKNLIFFLSVHPVLFERPGGAIAAALSPFISPFLCYAGRLLTMDRTIEETCFCERVCIECIYLKSGRK